MTPKTFELCAETLDACIAANEGGADRIELCVDLRADGLTPPSNMIEKAVKLSQVPVHVLVRPEADDFIYRRGTFERMKATILEARDLGIAGFVAGVLHPDCTVAVEPMRVLVELADRLPVEFHRAFDRTPDQIRALEAVVRTGCKRILTSGGGLTAPAGLATLNLLVVVAGERIQIAAGGGLRTDNIHRFAENWMGRHFHGSLGGVADDVAALVERIRRVREAIAV